MLCLLTRRNFTECESRRRTLEHRLVARHGVGEVSRRLALESGVLNETMSVESTDRSHGRAWRPYCPDVVSIAASTKSLGIAGVDTWGTRLLKSIATTREKVFWKQDDGTSHVTRQTADDRSDGHA